MTKNAIQTENLKIAKLLRFVKTGSKQYNLITKTILHYKIYTGLGISPIKYENYLQENVSLS